jgi:hypothetical protein
MTDEAFPETFDVCTKSSAPFSVLGDRFPTPWTVTVFDEGFVIRDAQLRPFAYIYFADSQYHSSNGHLTRDEAWQLATNISLIPDLISRTR